MTPLLYRVFCLTLTVFFLAAPAPYAFAQGSGDLMVKGVTVDVTADSALTARNKAFADARRKAYEQLASQYVPADKLAGLVVPDDAVLTSMVSDFGIEKERMTTHRYVGTVDVRFNSAVRNSFQTQSASAATAVTNDAGTLAAPASNVVQPGSVSRNEIITGAKDSADDYVYSPSRGGVVSTGGAVPASVPVTPSVSAPRTVLVLPWYGPRGHQTLWGQNNPWRDAWEANAGLSRDKSMPLLLPVGDVDDVRDYSPTQALSSSGSIDELIERYHASAAVLAVAEPAEGGTLIVSLYRMDDGTPVAMGRFGVDAGSGEESMKQAVDRAIVSMRAMPMDGALPITQASVTAAAPLDASTQPFPTTPNALYFVTLVHFNDLPQWVAIRNALSTTPGIQGLDVQSISPTQAQVAFAYSGDNGALSSLLAQKGLQIAPMGAASGPSVPGAMVPQYELTSLRSY